MQLIKVIEPVKSFESLIAQKITGFVVIDLSNEAGENAHDMVLNIYKNWKDEYCLCSSSDGSSNENALSYVDYFIKSEDEANYEVFAISHLPNAIKFIKE